MPRATTDELDLLHDLSALTPSQMASLSDEEMDRLAAGLVVWQRRDRQEHQLLYYKPVSPRAEKVHTSRAKLLAVSGGNRSSKTDSCLAELVMCSTGVIPIALKSLFPKEKLRGPINVRVVCESLTLTLHPVILYKLQYWQWSGVDQPGGPRGHWGWIPRSCLVEGDWDKSWSEKQRELRMYYRDPENPDTILGESVWQFTSFDQDPSDFASGEFHHVLMDEPPPYAIFRENRARVMSVGGRLMLSFTWPDDPSIPVEWLFDEVYEKAQPGPQRDPSVEWHNLFSTENPNIDQQEVASRAAQMSEGERQVRIYGQPIRFSNRIHPLFTDQPQHWCFPCGNTRMVEEHKCLTCHSTDVVEFTHVEARVADPAWPVIIGLDPHPRKPHFLSYWQVDPNDDLYCVGELLVTGDPVEVRGRCDDFEAEHKIQVRRRVMDPNMGRSPAGTDRSITWQDEFEKAGLSFECADDSDVGRARINEYLRPDRQTLRPRLVWHPRCFTNILQMKRFCWDEWKTGGNRDQKQRPIAKHDDMPAILRYIMNDNPAFSWLKHGGGIFHRQGQRSVHGY